MKKLTSILLIAAMILGLMSIAPLSAGAASASSYISTSKTVTAYDYYANGSKKAKKIVVPQIKLSTADAKEINADILDNYLYQNDRQKDQLSGSKKKFSPFIKYKAYLYGSVLSILIYMNNHDMTAYSMWKYTIDVKTGKEVTNAQILKKAGVTEANAKKLSIAAVKKDLESGKSVCQKDYAKYGSKFYQLAAGAETQKYNAYYFDNSGNLMVCIYNFKQWSGKYVGYSLATKIANAKSASSAYTPKVTKFENVDGGIKMAWNKVSGAKKYRLYYMTSSGWKRFGSDGTVTSCTINSLNAGQKYTFTVRALDSKGNGIGTYNKKGYSITYIPAPALPTLSNTKSGVKVSWKKVTGAVKYRVFRKTSGGKWTKVGDTTSTTLTDKTAKSGTKYAYTVRCISKDGKKYTSGFKASGKAITCKK